MILRRNPCLYLKDTGTKGRGVFCTSDIVAGAVLEVTPAVLLNEAATDHADNTILIDYTFAVGKVSKRVQKQARIRKTENACSVVFGVASFCNQGDVPNAEILWEEQDGTVYHFLKATRRIPKNTEICTTYGPGWFEDRK